MGQQFYNFTEKLKQYLLEEPFCNTVTYGDIFRIDLNKKTIFPLSHFIVNSIELQESTLEMDISLLCMDIVDISKEDATDIFLENDNSQDILNTQLALVSRIIERLRRGDILDDGFELVGTPSATPFEDRFENKLTGWSLDFTVAVPSQMSIC